ncbi:hypothetical protein BIV59_02010 [Bacillus sp. MUM 13]|nr:hypothetical protein BIV59_02010 [Bacillus sp. MUM 13]
MPSYNKYEYVSLSLHCLTRQTFDPAQFEVILIDDCSTDETPRLKNEFVSDFTFKYIRPHTNLGRSRARNLGIENSEGEVVIFMDAEMLTERNFIEEHYKHHIHESNVVVTGAMHYRGVYTFLTPLFNESQWSHIDGFLPRSAYFAGRYYDYKATYRNELTYFPLAGKEDINEGRIHDISFPNWYLTSILNSGLSHFGENLNGFALPYIAFLTGDVSVKKAMLNQTGYFDESFQGYGAEDWELGYRLFKNGAKFRVDPAAFCYHQEHPTSSGNFREAMGNLYKFMNKSPEIEVLALALEQRPGLNFLEIHYVVTQYKEMEAKFPNQYAAFKSAFISMMFKVVELLRDGQTVTRLVRDIDFQENEILDQLSVIRDHRWHMLADAFERLAKL